MFEVNQIFEGKYPPEAASFCNAQANCHIEEIEPTEDGTRRFQIVENTLPTDAELSQDARTIRDGLLASTDYLMLSDYPISDDDRAVILAYRQALRDVPQQDGFPTSISWPEKPSILKSE